MLGGHIGVTFSVGGTGSRGAIVGFLLDLGVVLLVVGGFVGFVAVTSD